MIGIALGLTSKVGDEAAVGVAVAVMVAVTVAVAAGVVVSGSAAVDMTAGKVGVENGAASMVEGVAVCAAADVL